MKYKCSMCSNVFESHTAPKSCPACQGSGKARYPKRLPAKRMTHKQIREAVRARQEQVTPPPGHIHAEVTIEI